MRVLTRTRLVRLARLAAVLAHTLTIALVASSTARTDEPEGTPGAGFAPAHDGIAT